jgi:ubiquinone/menaquinone biosynthesis C-methylase UbiE
MAVDEIPARKRRSWSIKNQGNLEIRRELIEVSFWAAGDTLRDRGEVLDAGCGLGWWLRRLAEEGVDELRLHGIDRSEERIARAAARLPAADLRVGDLRELPYEDGRFDAVFLLCVLSSMDDATAVSQALQEAWRVLGEGGVLAVWEPRFATPWNPRTRLIRERELAAATGATPEVRTVTVAPPLARRLGPAAERWYPRLARIPALRTHRMYVLRR